LHFINLLKKKIFTSCILASFAKLLLKVTIDKESCSKNYKNEDNKDNKQKCGDIHMK